MILQKITNLGTSLNKTEQQAINGGGAIRECEFSPDPSTDWCCHLPGGCPSDD